MSMKNNSGLYTTPGLRGIVAAAATVKTVAANNEMHIVNPPKADPLAYPICTFTYVIAADEVGQGAAAPPVHLLRGQPDAGPEARPEAALRTAAEGRPHRGREDAEAGPELAPTSAGAGDSGRPTGAPRSRFQDENCAGIAAAGLAMMSASRYPPSRAIWTEKIAYSPFRVAGTSNPSTVRSAGSTR